MSRVCQITGKAPQSGNTVSHSKHRVKRKFLPNLHKRRLFCLETGRFIKVKVSAHGLRIIDKVGLLKALEMGAALKEKG